MTEVRLPSARIMAEIARLIRQPGLFEFDGHALAMMAQRDILRAEVVSVLVHGHHAQTRDAFSERFDTWTYALEGMTPTGRRLRVAVAFVIDEPIPDRILLIITAIGLD